ncbi:MULTISPECIES: PAAR domain-containing protein [Rahnella]|uniref:PAAR domain-containing protein n=1 Tax=Rahnella victoriana TaxID=1510570 RepID=A0ABS0DVU4_9GAMM|nr:MULTISPECIES: PAAR domain-containing protein [Rahnella]MBF7956243.1 PAAR domain-containing protein [Rahnella victoriana]TBX35947.1 PAAR domain-containing protein [Rahnella victoriana]TDS88211.1 putative Zn-binding protein involved in type VI secretion [Rahnella sp. BIGb0236]
MKQPLIVTGDTTTHGGTLREGEYNFTVDGHYAVLTGHGFLCPICNVRSVFLNGAPNILINGRQRIRQGDKATCGAKALHTGNGVNELNG